MNLFPGNGPYAGLHNIDFQLQPNDKIVDIGAGGKPYPASTHIIDKIDNNAQRHGKNIKIEGRVFLNGDVCDILQDIPDNYFDFCYSSHTFEHIENLPEALELISKKCKRGFYALPASDFEFFTTQHHYGHVNLCRLFGDTLHIANRPEFSIADDFGEVYAKVTSSNKEFNNLYENKYRHIWEVRHYWEGEIKYEVHEDPADLYPQINFFKR